MKKLITLLFATTLLISINSFAQDFRVPAGQFKVKEDYAEYEKDIIAASKWLVATPPNEQVERRKQVNQFIVQWVLGSPTVYCMIPDAVTDASKKNIDLFAVYMAGVSRHVLENNYSKDSTANYKAGVLDMITVYKAGRGVKKDKKMQKIVDAFDAGKIDEWMVDSFFGKKK